MATDAGGVATEIFKVAVQDFITSSIAFEGDAVKFLQNPVNFWGFNTKERAKVELLGRILYHFFLAQPILAWPANLDPLVLLLSGWHKRKSVLEGSDFELSIPILGKLFNGLSMLSEICVDNPSAPQSPPLLAFIAELESWKGELGNDATEQSIGRLIEKLESQPEKAETYSSGKLMLIDQIAIGNRFMLLRDFFKGLNCTGVIALYDLNETVRDVYNFMQSQTPIENYDDIIPYISCNARTNEEKRSLSLLIKWLKTACVTMLQNFASNVTGHNQKLGIRFLISFLPVCPTGVSLQARRPYFHSCFG